MLGFPVPGGDHFVDVTELFEDAAHDMEPGGFVLTDGFTLLDSMSALEIGEPRMDTGMVLDSARRPPFEPLAPLLPSELCYILDRSFSAEMEWHAGYQLSQTVFTLLYVHELTAINPEVAALQPMRVHDPARPMALVTIVLRSAVLGLLKCCDLAWRELSRGRVFDTEDWQSEKSGVSLIEGIPSGSVVLRLEDACAWLLSAENHDLPYKVSLYNRIMLRKTLLELFDLNIFRDRSRFQRLVSDARLHLRYIREDPAPADFPTNSPAFLAFDPYVTRRLNSSMPLRVVPLPPQEHTWHSLEGLLDGLGELCRLSSASSFHTWKIVGSLHSTTKPIENRLPYLRSSAQSAFFDGSRIVGDLPIKWLVERFFAETLALSYSKITSTIVEKWKCDEPPYLRDVEQRLKLIIINYVRSTWSNGPRRRRHLSKSLYDWHLLYDQLLRLTGDLDSDDQEELAMMNAVPKTALLSRLDVIRQVIFTGFQMELYVPDERSFAYWYAAQVIQVHLSVLEEVEVFVSKDDTVRSEHRVQRSFLSALRAMCMGMFAITLPSIGSSAERLVLNLKRRYKWAIRPEYSRIATSPIGHPNLSEFLKDCNALLHDETTSPSAAFSQAKVHFAEILANPARSGWAGDWHADRLLFIRELSKMADRLSTAAPSRTADIPAFDQSVLDWEAKRHRWFPGVRGSGGS